MPLPLVAVHKLTIGVGAAVKWLVERPMHHPAPSGWRLNALRASWSTQFSDDSGQLVQSSRKALGVAHAKVLVLHGHRGKDSVNGDRCLAVLFFEGDGDGHRFGIGCFKGAGVGDLLVWHDIEVLAFERRTLNPVAPGHRQAETTARPEFQLAER